MANEDFTTWTEDDTDSQITVTSARVSVSGYYRSEGFNGVYTDKGAGAIDGDLEHDLTIKYDSSVSSGIGNFWCLSHNLNEPSDETDALSIFHDGTNLRLREWDGGTKYSDDYAMGTTIRYVTLERDESVGTHGTLYCRIYSDSARTTLVDTLSLTLHDKEDFRYIMIFAAQGGGSIGHTWTGYAEDLDLNEAAAGGTKNKHMAVLGCGKAA